MKFVLIPLAAVTLSMTACADSGANYRPILDGPATVGFQSDLAACQGLARDQRQFDNDTMAATVMGAGAGACLGALTPMEMPLKARLSGPLQVAFQARLMRVNGARTSLSNAFAVAATRWSGKRA